MRVVSIDGIQTAIEHIRGNVLKGYIVNKDLTINPCYVVKDNYFFAHGETLKEAKKALLKKSIDKMPIEHKINMFISKYKPMQKIKAKELFEWHHSFTGACELGAKSFCKNHNINIETDKFTIQEFIKLTENEYNGSVIKKLKEELKETYEHN